MSHKDNPVHQEPIHNSRANLQHRGFGNEAITTPAGYYWT
jgi:hypothetical protein